MQYIIMLLLVVVAAVTDVLTGLLKARITTGYNSTTMRKGLYCKAINIFVMIFFIAVEIGMEWLGKYYGLRARGSRQARRRHFCAVCFYGDRADGVHLHRGKLRRCEPEIAACESTCEPLAKGR